MFHDLPEFASSPPPRDKLDANSDKPCEWYGLWMRIKHSHNSMVMALGLCVKWPLAYF